MSSLLTILSWIMGYFQTKKNSVSIEELIKIDGVKFNGW